MNIIVAMPPGVAVTAGLDLALSLCHDDDRVTALVYRPAASVDDDALDRDIDAVATHLLSTGAQCDILPVVSETDMVTELVAAVDRLGAGLCVVEIPHTHATGASVLGKQAQRAILEIPCPVLVARPRKDS